MKKQIIMLGRGVQFLVLRTKEAVVGSEAAEFGAAWEDEQR
jgi:hypothetical protein